MFVLREQLTAARDVLPNVAQIVFLSHRYQPSTGRKFPLNPPDAAVGMHVSPSIVLLGLLEVP